MKNIFLFSLLCVTLLYNCNCGSGSKQSVDGISQDSIRILDSIRQLHIKDSIYTDSINKAANIEVKKVELPPEVQKQVNSTIKTEEENSFLKGKSEEEIFTMYKVFLGKYDPEDKTHKVELEKWTKDRFFQEMKEKDEWVVKIENLEEEMKKRK